MIQRKSLLIIIVGAMLLAACSAPVADGGDVDVRPTSDGGNVPESTDPPAATDEPQVADTEAPDPVVSDPNTGSGCGDPFEGLSIRFAPSVWPDTDFCKHSVPYEELFSGGPPPDGIRPIDDPQFFSVEEASEILFDAEPVIVLELNGDARAYPLRILILTEIVNDVVGDQPVTVTYCPLCNSAITFNRVIDGVTYDFGTSGNLRNSDLVMWDRQTKSWWQQLTGEAIVGEMTGTVLEFIPAQLVAWSDFRDAHPDGQVLSGGPGGLSATPLEAYSTNPYPGYDLRDPFLFFGEGDERLPLNSRVLAIAINGVDIVYPFSVLEEVRVLHDEVGGQPLVVFFKPGVASALDAETVQDGRDVGAAVAFVPWSAEQALTFHASPDDETLFVDEQTNSVWNILGQAIDGPLKGETLEAVVGGSHFWFAWAVFKPDTLIYTLSAS